MSKNRQEQFKKWIEEEIQAAVDKEAEGFHSELESVESHKKKVEAALRETLENHQDCIKRAIIELFESKKLDKNDYTEIQEKIENFSISRDAIDEEKIQQDYFHMSDRFYEKSMELGKELLDAGEYEKALDIFILLTNFKPNEYLYSLYLGVTAFNLKNNEAALLAFSNALILTETDAPIVMLWIADTLKAMNDVEDAKAVVGQVIDLVTGEEDYTDVLKVANTKMEQLAA